MSFTYRNQNQQTRAPHLLVPSVLYPQHVASVPNMAETGTSTSSHCFENVMTFSLDAENHIIPMHCNLQPAVSAAAAPDEANQQNLQLLTNFPDFNFRTTTEQLLCPSVEGQTSKTTGTTSSPSVIPGKIVSNQFPH